MIRMAELLYLVVYKSLVNLQSGEWPLWLVILYVSCTMTGNITLRNPVCHIAMTSNCYTICTPRTLVCSVKPCLHPM